MSIATPLSSAAHPGLVARPAWREQESDHARRADALTARHRARRQRGESHPVEDFLWSYYTMKPGELRRWHPGAGVRLEGSASQRGEWRHYRVAGPDGRDSEVDIERFFDRRGATVDYVERLLRGTRERTPRFGCFGLHEWAMVYRMTPEQLRHSALRLRIGHEQTDRVVEENPIACSHFDAYRFFTAEAAPLNRLHPTRETQVDTEQSACLHAGMDIYKWAGKLGPIVPGDILLDAFELARDIREVDMQASPYDVRDFTGSEGSPLHPIPIETAAGKREYVRRQRTFAVRGDALRDRLLDAIRAARRAYAARPSPGGSVRPPSAVGAGRYA